MPSSAVTKSRDSVFTNIARLKRAQDASWRQLRNAPMSTITKTSPSGKEYTRRLRVISPMSYKIAASGACAALAAETKIELEKLGVAAESESKTRPWSATMSPGACAVMDNFMVRLVQLIATNAASIKAGVALHKRTNVDIIKLAIDEVRKLVFHAASPAPMVTTVIKPKAPKKKAEHAADAK